MKKSTLITVLGGVMVLWAFQSFAASGAPPLPGNDPAMLYEIDKKIADILKLHDTAAQSIQYSTLIEELKELKKKTTNADIRTALLERENLVNYIQFVPFNQKISDRNILLMALNALRQIELIKESRIRKDPSNIKDKSITAFDKSALNKITDKLWSVLERCANDHLNTFFSLEKLDENEILIWQIIGPDEQGKQTVLDLRGNKKTKTYRWVTVVPQNTFSKTLIKSIGPLTYDTGRQSSPVLMIIEGSDLDDALRDHIQWLKRANDAMAILIREQNIEKLLSLRADFIQKMNIYVLSSPSKKGGSIQFINMQDRVSIGKWPLDYLNKPELRFFVDHYSKTIEAGTYN